MFEQIEIFSMLLSQCVLGFVLLHRRGIRHIRGWPWLLASFVFLPLSLLLSVLEGVFFPEILNVLQHFTSGLSGVLFACWCWFGSRHGEPSAGGKT